MGTPMTPSSYIRMPEISTRLYLGLLALVALLTFGRASVQGFPFLWDARSALSSSQELREGNVGEVARQAFAGTLDPSDRSGTFRPLSAVSLALNSKLTGYSSPGFHVVNLLLHILATLLVFLLAKELLTHAAAAASAGLFFAVHPMAAGTVGWVAGRAELLGACFALAATLLYRRASRESRPGISPAMFGAWALALLGMLSHESVLGLLLILPLLDQVAPASSRLANSGEFLRRQSGLWVAAFLYIALRVHAHPVGLDPGMDAAGSVLVRMLSIAQAVFYDILVAVLPPLSAVLLPLVTPGAGGLETAAGSSALLRALAGPGVLVLLAASAFFMMRNRVAGAGLAWFWLSLLPLLSFSVASATIPDHALYLPLAGLAVTFGAIALALVRRAQPSRGAAVAAILGWCLVCMIVGVSRVGLWKDEVALPARLATAQPGNPAAMNDLGAALGRAGKPEAALDAFRKARSADSLNAEASTNLALALVRAGKPDSALAILGPALQAHQGVAELHLALAEALLAKGRVEDAVSSYADVLDHDTTSVVAHMGLAQIYFAQKKFDLARIELDRARGFAPRDARVHNNLGLVEQELGHLDAAGKDFRRAVELDPAMPQFEYNLARLEYRRGHYAEALPPVRRLIQLLPGNPGPLALKDTIEARLARPAH